MRVSGVKLAPAAIVTTFVLALALSLAPPKIAASGAEQPTPTQPANGSLLPDFSVTLRWDLPVGATQYRLSVAPKDGPGIDLIRNAESGFAIPRPPQWYGLLPDMTYTWKLRASRAATAIGVDDPSWGPWSEPMSFRTPKVSSEPVRLHKPDNGSAVSMTIPYLNWISENSDIWYFEVQISKDKAFDTNTDTAKAPLYWEIVHGGTTQPTNNYQVPESQPLEPNTTYYWRVRPRVQGDGSPVDWTPPSSFSTSGTHWVSLGDEGKTIDLLVGDMLHVDLGTEYQWKVTVAKQGILEPVPTLVAMPALFRAMAPGETTISAVGDLPCHRAQPPCLAPSRSFEVQIVVHDDAVIVKAPIDDASIRIAESHPPQYFADVTSGLPNGCIRFYKYTVERQQEDIIVIEVLNLTPADPQVACTMVYGTVSSNIPLGSDFTSGKTYTVWVNDVKLTLVAQ